MDEQKQNISLLSLNVRGIRDKLKRSKIFSWIRHQRSDIILLQETFLTLDMEPIIKIEYNYHCLFNHGTNHSRGVAIFIRKNGSIEPLQHFSHFDGRVIAVRIKCGDNVYFVLNVYAPTRRNEKPKFFRELSKWLQKTKYLNDLLVFGGDWNYVQNTRLDTRGMSCTYKQADWFNKLRKRFHVIDVWREMFPFKKQFTWRQLSLKIFSRLDYWLVKDLLLSYVLSTEIKPVPNCDHCAITLRLQTSDTVRGCGMWKFNNSLLKDVEFKENIRKLISKFKLENVKLNAQTKWEMCKIRIKEYTIKYSKQKSCERKQLFSKLQHDFLETSKRVDDNPSEENIKKLEEIKKNIDQWLTYKCRGAFVRSRQKWMEKGEKSTKYFLQAEKRNARKKEIDCIKKNGKIITNQECILGEIGSYYTDLYSKTPDSGNPIEIDSYLATVDTPLLTDDEALLCEGILTEEECHEAIFSMSNNKSPGSDGLSVEFYKCLWDSVRSLVLDSLNEGFKQQELSDSQSLAILTLLYKKGDKQCLDNWRPISLLNIDYKILAKVLCKRLKQVIDKLISFDQTGYLKQRSAMQNLRLVQDIIEYCDFGNYPGILLFLDFKKAFDNVSHEFLIQLLQKFNFKESFINWIKVIYTNAVGSVINNGWRSQRFRIERGIRQGCPLSALLFLLVVEVMALKVKQNKNIHGITVSSTKSEFQREFKISQLADDTVIFVDSVNSANIALEEVKKFGYVAGPCLNILKTNAVAIQSETQKVKELEWTDEPVKYLGVYLTRNKNESEQLNWFCKVEKVKSILKYWKMRNLSFYGKVLILKSLIISQFVYVASVLPVPETIIIELNRLLYNFLWNSKREKVKRSVLLNPVEKGGLGMIDLKTKFQALQLSWFTNFLQCESDAPWKFMFRYWVERIAPMSLILRSNCSCKDMLALCRKYKLHGFYIQCLLSWSELTHIDFLQVDNIQNQVLWYNSHIRIDSKVLFFEEWYKKGILLIKDITENGCYKSRDYLCNLLGLNSLLVDFKYTKLKKAIPIVWKNSIQRPDTLANCEANCDQDDLYEIKSHEFIRLSTMKSKTFYDILCDFKKCDPVALTFWEYKFNLVTDFEWKDILKFKLKTLKNNKVKQCNFKTIHCILPYRYNLFRWKVLNENSCVFCSEKESFVHVLLECPRVTCFWKRIYRFISTQFHHTLLINEKLLIVGVASNCQNASFINTVLAYAQYSIYKTYMLNYFKGQLYNSFVIWHTLKNELLLDKVSHVLSNALRNYNV